MGTSFHVRVLPDPALKLTDGEIHQWFYALVAELREEHGTAGYTGTLAEKSTLWIHRERTFPTGQDAAVYIRDVLDHDRDGPADGVPVEGKGWVIAGYCRE